MNEQSEWVCGCEGMHRCHHCGSEGPMAEGVELVGEPICQRCEVAILSHPDTDPPEEEPEVRCSRCERVLHPNQNGGWFAEPRGHLSLTCDGMRLHTPAIPCAVERCDLPAVPASPAGLCQTHRWHALLGPAAAEALIGGAR